MSGREHLSVLLLVYAIILIGTGLASYSSMSYRVQQMAPIRSDGCIFDWALDHRAFKNYGDNNNNDVAINRMI